MNKRSNRKRLTADEIEVRIWALVVLLVSLILFFIVVALIYRTTFVIQPIKQISPMDQADQKMLNDIVLLIVGGIGGVMGRKGVKAASEMIAAVKSANPSPMMQSPMMMSPMMQSPMGMGMPQSYGSMQSFNQPPVVFNNNWTPPPPPSNPPVLEDEDERARMAHARESTKDA